MSKNSNLFLLDDSQQKMVNSIESFFSELILGHTAYQIENFIIGQFHTPDRKHRQCLQELHKRYRGVIQYHYEAKKIQIEIEREELKIEKYQRELQSTTGHKIKEVDLSIRESENEIEFRQWNLDILKRSLKETLREMLIFKKEIERLTPLRKHETYEEAEPEYWNTQYSHAVLNGKRGENLPLIPEVDRLTILSKIESQRKIKSK